MLRANRSRRTQGFLLAAGAACLLGASTASARPCEEIIDTGSYQTSSSFTTGPARVGCYVGQALGGVAGIPVMAVYTPTKALCDSSEDSCKDAASPIECGGSLVGNMLSHAIGFPFFLLETIFTGGPDNS